MIYQMETLKKRRGGVKIRKIEVEEYPMTIMKDFYDGEFFPSHIEYQFESNSYVFWGVSPNFQMVEELQTAPFYRRPLPQNKPGY